VADYKLVVHLLFPRPRRVSDLSSRASGCVGMESMVVWLCGVICVWSVVMLLCTCVFVWHLSPVGAPCPLVRVGVLEFRPRSMSL